MSPAAAALKGGVILYQWTLRPVLGQQCRFHPTCSDYAIAALETHGAARGAALAAGRILRCNPWHPGGPDPVPPPRSVRRNSPAAGRSGMTAADGKAAE